MPHLPLPPRGDIRDSKGHLKDLDDVDLAIAAGLGQILLCAFCSQERGRGTPQFSVTPFCQTFCKGVHTAPKGSILEKIYH